VHGSPRALALAGIVFLIADFSENLFAFATVHHIFPPSVAIHFPEISIGELITILTRRPLPPAQTNFPARAEKGRN
jgi:hypothetical protein